ncbi:MAG: 5-formyltetrahydrofolate cyclo-ligase [Neisseria elongata]
MNQTVRQQKKELRRLFRTERSRLGRNERRRAEQAVIRHLKPLVRRGKKIAVYWAMGSELNLSALFQTASERGATVYLPYIEPGCILWAHMMFS